MSELARAVVVAGACLALAGPVSADEGKDAARRGNALFEQRKFHEAVKAYEQAKEHGYATPAVTYNLGRAAAETGDLDRAADQFGKVVADPRSGALANSARFNLGALDYRRAKEEMEKDPVAALEHLVRSERAFRDVVEVNPEQVQAARNIETIMREAKRLAEEIEKQKREREQNQQGDQGQPGEEGQQGTPDSQNSGQESNKKSDQNQSDQQNGESGEGEANQSGGSSGAKQGQANGSRPDDTQKPGNDASNQPASGKEQLADLANKQSDLARRSERLSDDQQRARQDPARGQTKEELDRRANELKNRQEELSKQTRQALDQLKQEQTEAEKDGQAKEPEPDVSKLAEESGERAKQSQRQASDSLSKGDADRAAEQQREAARELAKAAGVEPPDGVETVMLEDAAEQVNLDAARILDKERREANQRLIRFLRQRSGRPPAAGKDW